jgi:membrane-associated phospholipid phosphatase
VGAEGRMGRRVALATWLVVAGVAAFAGAAAALRLGPPAWDPSLFAALNEVGVAWERILRPLASLASPVGLTIVAVLAATLVTVRNRSAVPLASCAVAGSGAWLVANLAKLIVDRPRPYETMVEAVLRQDPARGTSFPSSHTAVTVAVAIALLPFVSKPWRAAAVVFAVLVARVSRRALPARRARRGRHRPRGRRCDVARPRTVGSGAVAQRSASGGQPGGRTRSMTATTVWPVALPTSDPATASPG